MDLIDNSRPDASSPDGVTHVIAWFPPYLARSRRWPLGKQYRAGWWDLQEIAAWDASDPALRCDWSWDGPRDEDPARLAAWAAGILGCPVTLTAGAVDIRPGWLPFRRWRTEPLYWAVPGAGQ